MTVSLAQSLVEAAAEAMGAVAPKYDGPAWDEMDEGERTAVTDLAHAALSAALEKLAEAVEVSTEPGGALAVLDTYLLRDLAEQIRESPCP